MSIVANQIASAIHNARLYEERRQAAAALQEANASLEARVAERTAALERELRVAQALLNEARSRVEGPLLGGSAAVRGLRDGIARQATSDRAAASYRSGGRGQGGGGACGARRVGTRGRVHLRQLPRGEHAVSTRRRRDDVSRCGEVSHLRADLSLRRGGTVFLDAVHELPLDLQRALHARLERDRSGPPRGESGGSDVRLIASTTHDVRQPPPGGFLPLFQLLVANRLNVPPLAERREDIPALVDHFVRTARTAAGEGDRRRIAGLDASARSDTPGPETSAN